LYEEVSPSLINNLAHGYGLVIASRWTVSIVKKNCPGFDPYPQLVSAEGPTEEALVKSFLGGAAYFVLGVVKVDAWGMLR
jgi:UDP-N-acetyl-D-mannosaminuronic acid transferase (WecB/TagA/CpsF family)